MIHKKKKEKNYTMVDNNLINDYNLSWEAKGVLIYLLSKPENWKPSKLDIQRHASNFLGGSYPKNRIDNIYKQLITRGHLVLKHERNGNRNNGSYYDVYEEPKINGLNSL